MRISKLIKRIPIYTLILPAWILMISCGKEDGIGNNYRYGFENYPPNVAGLISSIPCKFGEGRFNMQYHTTAAMDGYGNPTLVQGTLTPGGLGGSPTSIYIGKGGNGDAIVVSKMSGNSSSVEITLSFCRQSITIGNTPNVPYLSDQRPPTIQLYRPIVVAPDMSCSAGKVSSGEIFASIPSFPYTSQVDCSTCRHSYTGQAMDCYYCPYYPCTKTNNTCPVQITAPATGVNINFAPGPCL